MDLKELEMILKEGEGYKIEFKEGFNNLDKEIVAFANSSGGRIFLGVTDEGKIKGIGISNELKSRIQDIANNCRPKIKISIDIFEKIFIKKENAPFPGIEFNQSYFYVTFKQSLGYLKMSESKKR